MGISDKFFKNIEKKTNVNKETILSLANKLQNGNMKDEKNIKEVIETLSEITGKNVTEEQQNKIIDAVINDKVPSNIDKYYN